MAAMQVLLVALAFAATAMAANVSTISNNNLVIGQAATFRVNLKFVSNGSIYQSAMFQTAVDDFSVVQIPLSFYNLTSFIFSDYQRNNLYVEVFAFNISTNASTMASVVYAFSTTGGQRRVVPYFTVLFSIEAGELQTAAWDWTDQCVPPYDVNVADNDARTNICFGPYNDCLARDGTSAGTTPVVFNECDLKIYVAWQGTDKNGRFCESSSTVSLRLTHFADQMFSRFQMFGVNNIVGQITSGASRLIAQARTTLTGQ